MAATDSHIGSAVILVYYFALNGAPSHYTEDSGAKTSKQIIFATWASSTAAQFALTGVRVLTNKNVWTTPTLTLSMIVEIVVLCVGWSLLISTRAKIETSKQRLTIMDEVRPLASMRR